MVRGVIASQCVRGHAASYADTLPSITARPCVFLGGSALFQSLFNRLNKLAGFGVQPLADGLLGYFYILVAMVLCEHIGGMYAGMVSLVFQSVGKG